MFAPNKLTQIIAATSLSTLALACNVFDAGNDGIVPDRTQAFEDDVSIDTSRSSEGVNDLSHNNAGTAPSCEPMALKLAGECTDQLAPLETVACDGDTHLGETWNVTSTVHFRFYTLPGTAADNDIGEVVKKREDAYTAIAAQLGVPADTVIDLFLSPSRIAADAHDLSMGRSFPWAGRMEVVYTGAKNGFESRQYGHELTHMLAYKLDPDHTIRVGVLSEGLAELLDQSDRDLHLAYAAQLKAGAENRVHVASFDSRDVWGNNYGRAGSFVRLLVERYGWDAFLRIYRAGYVQWQSGCYRHPAHGCLSTADDLTRILAGLVEDETGETWDELTAAWRAEVQAALKVPQRLSAEDEQEIRTLIAHMDRAISDGDADAYRATMEGFYCDWGGESMRKTIAERATTSFIRSSSAVVQIHPTGIKNFETARATILRRTENDILIPEDIYLEKYPSGWRINYGPDWY